MNKERKAQWIEALRSGKYKQGRCYLRIPKQDGVDEFCCLGVACDISEVGRWVDGDFVTDTTVTGVVHSRTAPPPIVCTVFDCWAVNPWCVLTDKIPAHLKAKLQPLIDDTLYNDVLLLMTINDSGLLDFVEIAELIEVAVYEDVQP